METKTKLYTDGACLGNPGAGGWASILYFKSHDDFLYYHLSFIHNLTINKVEFGLGNFDLAFNHVSSLFFFHSLVGPASRVSVPQTNPRWLWEKQLRPLPPQLFLLFATECHV